MSTKIPILNMSIGAFLARALLLFIVVIWTLPTFGLFISSLRDKDQLAISGWWNALQNVQESQAGRTGTAADQIERDGEFVIVGNVFDADSVKNIATYGDGLLPGEITDFTPGETVDLEDGKTFTLNADGTYEYTSPEAFELTAVCASSTSPTFRHRSR